MLLPVWPIFGQNLFSIVKCWRGRIHFVSPASQCWAIVRLHWCIPHCASMYLDWPTSVRRIWRHFWAAAPSACLIPARSASAGCCFGFCSHLLLPTAEWYDPNWTGYPFGVFFRWPSSSSAFPNVFSGWLRPSQRFHPAGPELKNWAPAAHPPRVIVCRPTAVNVCWCL